MTKRRSPVDSRHFRDALGQFATGVTIVTARDADQRPVGMTVSSFNSVSLDPPLILWSISKASGSLPAFETAGSFAVHVLASDQQALAYRFAKRGIDKFSDLILDRGIGGAPLIPDCAACFQCETRHRYEGGDHVIIVGEVLEYQRSERSPLIFHGGRFACTRYVESADDADKPSVDLGLGSFTPDFLGYLLARAHFQLYRPLIAEARKADISEVEYFVLSVLCIRDRLSHGQLNAFLSHTGCAPSLAALADLERRGLIATDQDLEARFSITEFGRDTYIGILMLDKLLEERALAEFEHHEVVDLTAYLRRIIANTDPGVPDLWSDAFADPAVFD